MRESDLYVVCAASELSVFKFIYNSKLSTGILAKLMVIVHIG